HGNIVPIGEFLGDAAIARRIVLFEIVQRGVGEHHAEAEGVVGAVALIDRDLGLRPLLSQQDRGIETGRSAADDRNLHNGPPALLAGHHPNCFKPKVFSRQGCLANANPDGAQRNPGFPVVGIVPGFADAPPGLRTPQFPWNAGFTLFENASKARAKSAVVMHSACATASASIASSTDIAHSMASIRFVMVLANVGPSEICFARSCACSSTCSMEAMRLKKP